MEFLDFVVIGLFGYVMGRIHAIDINFNRILDAIEKELKK